MIDTEKQKQELMRAVAERIRHFRRLHSYSQEALALNANLHPAHVGQIERGLKCPTIDTLCRIADALDVPVTALLSAAPPSQQTEAYVQRLRNLLVSVPEDKLEQVLQIMEQVIALL